MWFALGMIALSFIVAFQTHQGRLLCRVELQGALSHRMSAEEALTVQQIAPGPLGEAPVLQESSAPIAERHITDAQVRFLFLANSKFPLINAFHSCLS